MTSPAAGSTAAADARIAADHPFAAHLNRAAGRDITKISDLADRGLRVSAIDYTDVGSLKQAFTL